MNVLLTGATKGIGYAIALQYLRHNYNVIGIGRDKEALHELKKRYKDKFTGIATDLFKKKEVSSLLKTVSQMEIDVLINNAGTNRISAVFEIKQSDWDDIIFLNLTLPMMFIRAVTPHMIKRHFGRIVNISSIYSEISRAKRSSYSSSKSGLNGLTRASALDLAGHQVLVNSVSPGFTGTELTKTILSKNEIQMLINNIPLGRMAEPAEIALLVYFLGSKENTYITGQNFVIDGGYSIQ